jgi:hypothetical protein
MGRLHIAEFGDVAITAAQDFFEIGAASTGIIRIHEVAVFQTTDVGDAAEEILELEFVRGDGTVTSGTGGSTVTPQPIDNGDTAPAATVEANNTTRMVVGTGVLDAYGKIGWNVRIPFEKVWTPETRPIITPSDRWTFSLNDAPADSITCSGTVVFEEIGG